MQPAQPAQPELPAQPWLPAQLEQSPQQRPRRRHAARSAALARTLLRRLALFSAEEIERVCAAIACHSDKAHAHAAFAEVLLDADVLQHGLYNPTLFLLEEEVARFRALQQEFSLAR